MDSLHTIGFYVSAALSIAGLLVSALLLPESDGLVGLFAAGWSGRHWIVDAWFWFWVKHYS